MSKKLQFKSNIASLLNYQCPDWFRDAKFGIYVHWGVYSVPERGEWYPRNMYLEGHPDYQHHIQNYGHPSEFGYKDLIPLWTADKWDPEELVSLFKRAGARYFTPCAVHHDNFDLWDSKFHRWNSVNMGPKKDITRQWQEAALNQGLRFGVTTHLERTWSWFNTNKGADCSGTKVGVPFDGSNTSYSDFYLDPHADTDLRHPLNAPKSWCEHWAARIKDLIDNYHPDLLYFDGCIPFAGEDNGQTGLDVIAHYYNDSIKEHDGDMEAVMCVKDLPDHGIYVDGVTTLDLERTRLDNIRGLPWQTDTSTGPWGYHSGIAYRPVKELIHELIDIVSKNGNVLLNVPPKADGTLDSATVQILESIGQWLDINGEAIYGTRPWVIHGHDQYRFTRAKDAVYVHLLEWPKDNNVITIPSLVQLRAIGPISKVQLLGCNKSLRWGQDTVEEGALRIVLPEQTMGEHAWVFKVQW